MFGAPLLLLAILAPPPEQPAFEVVSIRAVPPDAPTVIRSVDFSPALPGGQFVDSCTSLPGMIAFAYNVQNRSQQLVGLPDWAKKQWYAVSAKPSEGFPLLPVAQNWEQVRAMMRRMLEDRFRLRVLTESRRGAIFLLKVMKGGIKTAETTPPVPPEKETRVSVGLSDRGGRMIGAKSTMAGVAAALAVFLRNPVTDATGLRGYYNLNLSWTSPGPPAGDAPGGLGADGISLLISMLRDQLGLQLVKTTGPVPYWVVERVEPPTEN